MRIKLSIEELQKPKPLWKYVFSWALLFPMIVFAAGGEFSIQAGSRNVAFVGLGGGGAEAQGEREVLILTYFILTVLILISSPKVLRLAADMKALTLLPILAIVSAAWSQYPSISFIRGGYFLFDTFFAYWLLQKLSTARLRSFIMMTGTVVALASIVLVIALPKFGIVGALSHLGAWQGIFTEKNLAGKSLTFLLTPAVDFSRRPSPSRIAYLCTILGLIVMSQSRTAWAISAIYLFFMFLLSLARSLEYRIVALITFTVSSTLVLGFVVFILNWQDIFLALGVDPTLTGRIQIWNALLVEIAARPWGGYGYQAFWSGLEGASRTVLITSGWAFSYAHNGILEILLQLGVAGLVIVLFLLVLSVRNAWFCFHRSLDPDVPWYIGLIFLTLLYNIDEGTLIFPHALYSVLFTIACAGLILARNKVLRSARDASLSEFAEPTRLCGPRTL
jgi:O-antigen ligase